MPAGREKEHIVGYRLTKSQLILGGKQDRGTGLAQNVCLSLDRTLYGISLLPPDHPQRNTMILNLLEAMQEFFEEFGPLELTVDAERLIYNHASVLKIRHDRNNYIYRMYRDGVIVLNFTPDIDEESLHAFMTLLSTDFEHRKNREDDIVSLLWNANINGISFQSSETFMECESVNPGEEQAIKLSVDDIRKKLLARKHDNYAAEDVSANSAFVKQIHSSQILKDERDHEPESFNDEIFIEDRPHSGTEKIIITPEDRERFHNSISSRLEDGVYKFAAVLASTNRAFPEAFEKQAFHVIKDYAECCFESLSEKNLLVFVETFSRCSGGKLPQIIINALAEESIVEMLLLRMDSDKNNVVLFRLFDIVAPTAFEIIWNYLDKLKDMKLRQILAKRIHKYIKTHKSVMKEKTGKRGPSSRSCGAWRITSNIPFLREYLKNCDENNALLTLNTLKNSDRESLSPTDFINGLAHSSPGVRLQTLKCLRQWIGDRKLEEALKPLFSDSDRSVRILLLKYIIHARCTRYDESISKRLDAKLFSRCDTEEKQLVIDALASVCGLRGIKRLRALSFTGKSGKYTADTDIRIYSIKKLAKMGDYHSMDSLKKISRSWFIDRSLKDAARTALKMIKSRE